MFPIPSTQTQHASPPDRLTRPGTPCSDGIKRLSLLARFLFAVALAGVFAAPALADRKATPGEREKIEPALTRAGFDCDIYPPGSCRLEIRISTENERWAGAYIRARHDDPQVQPEAGSLEHKHHRWTVHQVGNGGGCNVPSRVAKDLHLECY